MFLDNAIAGPGGTSVWQDLTSLFVAALLDVLAGLSSKMTTSESVPEAVLLAPRLMGWAPDTAGRESRDALLAVDRSNPLVGRLIGPRRTGSVPNESVSDRCG